MPIEINIWTRISQSDMDAYAIMYREYFRRFFNYGKKFIEDEILIEDAAQEALLMIWEKRSLLPEIKFPGTYFYSAFRNILFTKMRKSSPVELPGDTLAEPGFNAEQIIFEKETNEELKQKLGVAIQQLTARQREAIFLKFYEGFSYEEVASILDITVKSTYKIMARAIATLKENIVFASTSMLVAILCELLF